VAFAAEITREPLAIGSLRKHAGERKFADAVRTGEQHRVRNAAGVQHASQRRNYPRIA
jgi:hypothetical protein